MSYPKLPLALAISFLLLPSAVNSNTQQTQQPQTIPQLVSKRLLQNTEDNPHLELLLEVQALKYELELLKLQEQKEIMQLERTSELQTEKSEVVRLTIERDRQLLENELKAAKYEEKLAKLRTLKEQIELENGIQEAKQRKDLITTTVERDKTTLENELAEQKRLLQVAELEQKQQTLALKNAIQEERNRQQELALAMERSKLEFEMVKLEYERAKKDFEEGDLSEKMARLEQRRAWEKQADKEPKYLKEPFQDERLILSDRRILLDGPIYTGTAAYISERIHFFNNKNEEYPIFLVIDNSPGGSVMEGMRILEAMHGSHAPVYVVVKSLAASMAAVITALADKSYAYPNAIFLHHQVWSGFFGNKTQQEEYLEITKEWSKRVMEPVAEKMGLTQEEMVELMYENNSDGNWREFADRAQQLKWVDHITKQIDETAYLTLPDEQEQPQFMFLLSTEKTDKEGKPYMQLPPLSAGDVYHLYNPNGYYRW